MLNENERNFVELLEKAKRYVKGELELDCFDGEWFAMDYREDFGCAFPIETNGFDKPIITNKKAEVRNIDIVKCCDECGILYVG